MQKLSLPFLNLKLIVLVIALTALALSGCNKEKPGAETEKANNKLMSTVSLGVFSENTMPWSEIVKGYDAGDTKRRHAKLFLSIGLT